VTRLDRLGLPVAVSVRPRGQLLRVHAGKGLQTVDARVGALMEGIEHAVAEATATRWSACPMSLAQLQRQARGHYALADVPCRLGSRVDMTAVLSTVQAEQLQAPGGTVAVPAAWVFLPWVGDPGEAIWGCTGNGLASGNTLGEATLHGLLEVLERDALAMNRAADRSWWVEPQSLPQPWARTLRSWAADGVHTAVRAIPNAFDLPCFEAHLHEPQGTCIDLAAGSGLHLDAGTALTRALCEAAQSRLSYIHGGRDDIEPFFAQTSLTPSDQDAKAALLQRRFDRTHPVRFADCVVKLPQARSISAALKQLLGRLNERGFRSVLRHRFELGPRLRRSGLQVVKIIVPGCEDNETDSTRLGPRLQRRLLDGL
jgi:ribosomal protein S12 methylthiotransferase accessory factor